MLQFFIFFSFALQPQRIELNIDATIEGKKLDAITTVEVGKTQIVEQKIGLDTFSIELTPRIENGDELHLALKVLENKKMLSNPEIITFDQQEAVIETFDKENKSIHLSITPKVL